MQSELVKLLTESGKSELALSRMLKVSCSTIGRWRRGTSAPYPTAYPHIIAALKASLNNQDSAETVK